MNATTTKGHFAASLTIFIWGTTFISTKILLVDFQPIEILFFRFLIGLLTLSVLCPRRLKVKVPAQELTFMAAGLCGICLYYLLENIALTYTSASNVGIIISVAPFFTAMLSHFFLKEGKNMPPCFFIGFLVAMCGICMISIQGTALSFHPIGDFLALPAAWLVRRDLLMPALGHCDGRGYPIRDTEVVLTVWF